MGKNEGLKKAFDMATLFMDPWFDEIQPALKLLEQNPEDANAVKIIEDVAKRAGFKKKRQEWLSNYLKNYKTKLNGPDSDADTGW